MVRRETDLLAMKLDAYVSTLMWTRVGCPERRLSDSARNVVQDTTEKMYIATVVSRVSKCYYYRASWLSAGTRNFFFFLLDDTRQSFVTQVAEQRLSTGPLFFQRRLGANVYYLNTRAGLLCHCKYSSQAGLART